MRFEVQGAYEKKKEAVTEEMEVEAGKMEKDLEEDFGVVSKLPTRGQLIIKIRFTNMSRDLKDTKCQVGRFAKYQRCLWDLMEKPDTSVAAKVLVLKYQDLDFTNRRSLSSLSSLSSSPQWE